MLPETVFDLPAHILTIHAVVVLVPLAAFGVLLLALVPRARRNLRWPVLFVLTAALVAVPVATQTGDRFRDRLLAEGLLGGVALEKVALHEQLAELVLWPVLALWILAVGLVLLDRARRRGALLVAVATLAVVAALGSTVQIVRAGHAGSTAVWNPGD